MSRLRILVFVLILMSIFLLPVSAQANTYTTEDVLAAYEAGQFRVIETNGSPYDTTADGRFIAVLDDGVYRVSDGVRILELVQPRFGPDGNYVYQVTNDSPLPEDGLYRLSDGERIVTFRRAPYTTPADPYSMSLHVLFSENGEYVSVSKNGVYHLPDGRKVFDTDRHGIRFGPDSTLIATADGVFRLSDGQQIVEMRGSEGGMFSPDGAYVWARNDGVYRLSDGQKIIKGIGDFVNFSPDMAYAVLSDNGVYRLSDGQRVFQPFGYLSYFTSDSRYVTFSTTYDRLYRVSDGELLLETHDLMISPNEAYAAVMLDGVYRLNDMHKLFDIGGEYDFAWLDFEFSRDSAYLVVSGDGLYRTADGQKILDSDVVYGASFSQDSQYLAVDFDGLYRTADGEKLFDIDDQVITFTPDDAAVLVMNSDVGEYGLYRVRDGRKFDGLRLLNVSAGLLVVDSTVMVIDRQIAAAD